jgi:hypothetical protein
MDASVPSDSGGSGDVAVGADGGPAADSATPGDAANADGPEPVDSGIADSGQANADGATTDGGCDPFPVVADAAPGTCAFTPADLACKTFADCILYVIHSCSCPVAVIGVSKTSTALCVPPPCPAPQPDSGCFGAQSYESQDCIVSNALGEIIVDCMNGQCMTQAALPGH